LTQLNAAHLNLFVSKEDSLVFWSDYSYALPSLPDTYEGYNRDALLSVIIKEKFSYIASFEEIQENDFNLNNPRYVDTFEEEAEVDIMAVQQEIEQLEGELSTVQEEMAKYLKELGV
jgi:type I restriction enzyme M protein